jgi:septal ring factor EnvC (AmiA/AmiB activator)
MLLEINAKKTEAVIFDAYNDREISNVEYYRSFMTKMNRDFQHLNHCRAEILGKINSDFYLRTKSSNNIEYRVMKEVENLKQNISDRKKVLQEVVADNAEMQKKQSTLHQSQQELINRDQSLQGSIRQLKNQIAQAKNVGNNDHSKMAED